MRNLIRLMHFLPKKSQGCGKLHGKALTSTPVTVQMPEKMANARSVRFAQGPGRILRTSKQTDILAQPMLAM